MGGEAVGRVTHNGLASAAAAFASAACQAIVAVLPCNDPQPCPRDRWMNFPDGCGGGLAPLNRPPTPPISDTAPPGGRPGYWVVVSGWVYAGGSPTGVEQCAAELHAPCVRRRERHRGSAIFPGHAGADVQHDQGLRPCEIDLDATTTILYST